MNSNILPQLASLDLAEANGLAPILQGMSEDQQTQFMSIYLSTSLLTSLLMNWYNTRAAIKER